MSTETYKQLKKWIFEDRMSKILIGVLTAGVAAFLLYSLVGNTASVPEQQQNAEKELTAGETKEMQTKITKNSHNFTFTKEQEARAGEIARYYINRWATNEMKPILEENILTFQDLILSSVTLLNNPSLGAAGANTKFGVTGIYHIDTSFVHFRKENDPQSVLDPRILSVFQSLLTIKIDKSTFDLSRLNELSKYVPRISKLTLANYDLETVPDLTGFDSLATLQLEGNMDFIYKSSETRVVSPTVMNLYYKSGKSLKDIGQDDLSIRPRIKQLFPKVRFYGEEL